MGVGSRCANISCYTLLLVNQKSFSPCYALCGNCTVSGLHAIIEFLSISISMQILGYSGSPLFSWIIRLPIHIIEKMMIDFFFELVWANIKYISLCSG